MKKWIRIFLAAALAAGLAGCTKRDGTEDDGFSDEETAEISSILVEGSPWVLEQDQTRIYEFREGGEGVLKEGDSSSAFTYALRSKSLLITFDSGEQESYLLISWASGEIRVMQETTEMTFIPYEEEAEQEEEITGLWKVLMDGTPWMLESDPAQEYVFSSSSGGAVIDTSTGESAAMSYTVSDDRTVVLSYGSTRLVWTVSAYTSSKVTGEAGGSEWNLVPYQKGVSAPEEGDVNMLAGDWTGTDESGNSLGLRFSTEEGESGVLTSGLDGSWTLADSSTFSWKIEDGTLRITQDGKATGYEYLVTDKKLVLIDEEENVWVLTKK